MDQFFEENIVKKNKVLSTITYWMAWTLIVIFGVRAARYFYSVVGLFYDFSWEKAIPVVVNFLVFGGLTALLWWRKDFLKCEYEYSITNGTVDIAQIINNARRKELISFRMKEVRRVAPLDRAHLPQLRSYRGAQRIKARLNRDEQAYFVYVQRGGEDFLVIMEPSDGFLLAMREAAKNTNCVFEV